MSKPTFISDHAYAVKAAEIAAQGLSGGAGGTIFPEAVVNTCLGPLIEEEKDMLRGLGIVECPELEFRAVEVPQIGEAARAWDVSIDRSDGSLNWKLHIHGMERVIQGVVEKSLEGGKKDENLIDGIVLLLWRRVVERFGRFLGELGWKFGVDGYFEGVMGDLVEKLPKDFFRGGAANEARIQWARLRGVMGNIVPVVRWVIKTRMESILRDVVERHRDDDPTKVNWEAASKSFVDGIQPVVRPIDASKSVFWKEGEKGRRIPVRLELFEGWFGPDPSDGTILKAWGARAGLLAIAPEVPHYVVEKHFPPKPDDDLYDDWLGVDFADCMLALQKLHGLVGPSVANKAKVCLKFVRDRVMHDVAFLREEEVESEVDLFFGDKGLKGLKGIRWMLTDFVLEVIRGASGDPRCAEHVKKLKGMLERCDGKVRLWLPDAGTIDPETGLVYATSGEMFDRVKEKRLCGNSHLWRYILEPWDSSLRVVAPPGRKVQCFGEGVNKMFVTVYFGVGGMGKSTIARYLAKKAYVEGKARHVLWIGAENEEAAQASLLEAVEEVLKWESDGLPRESVLELKRAKTLATEGRRVGGWRGGGLSSSDSEVEFDGWAPGRALLGVMGHLPGEVLVVLDNLDPWARGSKGWIEGEEVRKEFGRFLRGVGGEGGRVRIVVTSRFGGEDERLGLALRVLLGGDCFVEVVDVDEIEEVEDRVCALKSHLGRDWRSDGEEKAGRRVVEEGMIGGWPLGLMLAGKAGAREGLEKYVEEFERKGLGKSEAEREFEEELKRVVVDGVDGEMGRRVGDSVFWGYRRLRRLSVGEVESILRVGWEVAEDFLEEMREVLKANRSKLRKMERKAKNSRERWNAVVELSLGALGVAERDGAGGALCALAQLAPGVAIDKVFLEEVLLGCGILRGREEWMKGLEGDARLYLEGLLSVGLVQMGEREGSVVVHRVVASAAKRIRGGVGELGMEVVRWGVVKLLDGGPSIRSPLLAEAYGAPKHARFVCVGQSEASAAVLVLLGNLECTRGCLDVAWALYKESLGITERVVGKETEGYATALQNMAGVEQTQGRLDAAWALYEESLGILERVVGKETEGYAVTLQSMAGIEQDRGRLDSAWALYEESLGIKERVLGKETEGYATTLQNMAGVEQTRGRLDSAWGLYKESLGIWKRVLGKETEGYAVTLQNMAVIEKDRGCLDSARALFEESLGIKDRVVGKETEGYATTLQNMALIEKDRGRLDAAWALFEESLGITERVLGKETEGYATTLHNMALIEKDRGRMDAAWALFEESLGVTERVVGKETEGYAVTLQSMAGIEKARGRLDLAWTMYEESLGIRERVVGKETESYATVLHHMAFLWKENGHLTLCVSALEICHNIIFSIFKDSSHPRVQQVRHDFVHFSRLRDTDRRVETTERLRKIRAQRLANRVKKDMDNARALSREDPAASCALFSKVVEATVDLPSCCIKEHLQALLNISYIKLRTADPEAALEATTRALRADVLDIHGLRAKVYFRRAQALIALGDISSAIRLLRLPGYLATNPEAQALANSLE